MRFKPLERVCTVRDIDKRSVRGPLIPKGTRGTVIKQRTDNVTVKIDGFGEHLVWDYDLRKVVKGRLDGL